MNKYNYYIKYFIFNLSNNNLLMKHYLALYNLNFDKNIFCLREKLSQDLYMRKCIYNINTRKPKYGINQNAYVKNTINVGITSRVYSKYNSFIIPTLSTRSNSNSIRISPKKYSPTRTTFNKYSPKRVSTKFYCPRALTRSENLSLIKNKHQKDLEKEIRIQNLFFKNNIKRVSSPYSRDRLKYDVNRSKKISQMRKQIRPIKVIKDQERFLLGKLPKIY